MRTMAANGRWTVLVVLAAAALGWGCAGSTVVINEVGWAGTAASTSDEWIELHNAADTDVNLAGWTLSFGDTLIHLGVAEGDTLAVRRSTIEAGGYLLLERTDDQTISDIQADVLYKGTLPNGGMAIELRDDQGTLVDRVEPIDGAWPAGMASGGDPSYGSMERMGLVDGADWATNDGRIRNGLDADGQPINGTPGRENGIDLISRVAPRVELLWAIAEDEAVGGVVILEWTATDPDGAAEALRISIELSSDEGETWEILAAGLANGGSFAWDTSLHDDSDAMVLRIIAEDPDGYWGRASSDTFTIRNEPG